MSDGISVAQLEGVDGFARTLYRRAKSSGADFDDVAAAIRRLHTVLKHLVAEAEDADSLLNSDRAAVYARQLTPVVEDCDFTLKQFDTILGRHAEGDASSPEARERERGMVRMLRARLEDHKLHIDMFLDTVQLHNPSKTQSISVRGGESGGGGQTNGQTNGQQLDAIKDKVDAIAARICRQRQGGGGGFADDGFGDDDNHNDDEETWQQFRTELEKEGFSKDVLRQNKDVLRAYIRELETIQNETGPPPSVRGLLEQEQKRERRYPQPNLSVVPASYPDRQDLSPKELMHPTFDNEKYAPSMKMARRTPEMQPPNLAVQHSQLSQLSYDKHSSDDDYDGRDVSSLALISTRDLMVMDTSSSNNHGGAGFNAQMAALSLHPHASPANYSVSPTASASASARYLPPAVAAELSSSPSNHLSVSPRFVPPLPTYSAAPGSSPPPPYGSSPWSQQQQQAYHAHQQQPSRLAPDRYGMDIPLDAKWTRIRRSLVSPEVLEHAGVRYEARPDFVAVLGELSREDIAHYANLSAVARARRSNSHAGTRPPAPPTIAHLRPAGTGAAPRDMSASRRGSPPDDDRHRRGSSSGPRHSSDSDSVLWDESDTTDDETSRRRHGGGSDEKKRRPYFIVPAPSSARDRTSPASTVQPKPILKNRNENHVRFDPEPHEVTADEMDKSARSAREGERRRRSRRDREREYHHESSANKRERDRDRDRDRGDREYSASRRHRERDARAENRDARDRKDKKKLGTLGAMGIGGAAGSLLSVLTEAANGAGF
ncbi:hypothetical protein BN1708_011718 [Verticillium longisporum]|uniref:DUF8035 domain-containing protein n=1 Tax=Verticillium longisporum TaxID=100787 RepID=A0A0G4L2S7_VERLO|nr:hypothetical protein BN1708_011718 [Verticillium longisporum]